MEATLRYGMKVKMTENTISYVIGGIGISSSSNQEEGIFVIEKYWPSDTDPNSSHKVRLVPEDQTGKFGITKMYCSDLKSSIKSGSIQIVE